MSDGRTSAKARPTCRRCNDCGLVVVGAGETSCLQQCICGHAPHQPSLADGLIYGLPLLLAAVVLISAF